LRDQEDRIEGVVAMVTDITERKALLQRLEHEAYHDSLTDLANRRLFRDRLSQALQEAVRYQRPVAVLLLDCNRFKEINDRYGHDVGDQFLRELGSRIQRTIRSADTLARLGGDEFAILMPQTGVSGIRSAARSVLQALSKPMEHNGTEIPFVVSIGGAVAPQHGEEARLLLRAADEAMYVAKRAGGGFRFAPDSAS
jgi:diguanylate cyclase (GGDEF)-like protein